MEQEIITAQEAQKRLQDFFISTVAQYIKSASSPDLIPGRLNISVNALCNTLGFTLATLKTSGNTIDENFLSLVSDRIKVALEVYEQLAVQPVGDSSK